MNSFPSFYAADTNILHRPINLIPHQRSLPESRASGSGTYISSRWVRPSDGNGIDRRPNFIDHVMIDQGLCEPGNTDHGTVVPLTVLGQVYLESPVLAVAISQFDRRQGGSLLVEVSAAQAPQCGGDLPGLSHRDSQRACQVVARNGFVMGNEDFECAFGERLECWSAIVACHAESVRRPTAAVRGGACPIRTHGVCRGRLEGA
jgi:hypothetical protein